LRLATSTRAGPVFPNGTRFPSGSYQCLASAFISVRRSGPSEARLNISSPPIIPISHCQSRAATSPAATVALGPQAPSGAGFCGTPRVHPHSPHLACGHPLPFPRARYRVMSGRHVPVLADGQETELEFISIAAFIKILPAGAGTPPVHPNGTVRGHTKSGWKFTMQGKHPGRWSGRLLSAGVSFCSRNRISIGLWAVSRNLAAAKRLDSPVQVGNSFGWSN